MEHRGNCESAQLESNPGTVLENVFYFSDETGQHTGGRYFLIAGVAFQRYRIWTKDQLLQAERVSDKGKKDWHATKNPAQRVRYITEVLRIDSLNGSVFHSCYRDNGKQYWDCTVDALLRAIHRFGAGRHNIIIHQGFAYGARKKLENALRRANRSFEIQPGNQNKRAEIRLADALCGYIAIMNNPDSAHAHAYPHLPDWFVDLKNEAPLRIK